MEAHAAGNLQERRLYVLCPFIFCTAAIPGRHPFRHDLRRDDLLFFRPPGKYICLPVPPGEERASRRRHLQELANKLFNQ